MNQPALDPRRLPLRPLHVATYNALPTTARRTQDGQYFALVNGEWSRIAFIRQPAAQNTRQRPWWNK